MRVLRNRMKAKIPTPYIFARFADVFSCGILILKILYSMRLQLIHPGYLRRKLYQAW